MLLIRQSCAQLKHKFTFSAFLPQLWYHIWRSSCVPHSTNFFSLVSLSKRLDENNIDMNCGRVGESSEWTVADSTFRSSSKTDTRSNWKKKESGRAAYDNCSFVLSCLRLSSRKKGFALLCAARLDAPQTPGEDLGLLISRRGKKVARCV